MNQIEQLPSQLAKRNWIILALLLLGSLPFGNVALSSGILVGGLVAITGFLWMRRSLGRVLEQPSGGAQARYQIGYIFRLVALSATLVCMIAVFKIHTVGLIIGLSVVVVNLFLMTIQRAFK